MYTAIREPDGSIQFVLHRAPERLTPDEAREVLSALGVLLDDLRRRASLVRTPEGPERRPLRTPAVERVPRGPAAPGRRGRKAPRDRSVRTGDVP